MTIKVCKKKLNDLSDKAVTLTGQTLRWGSFFILPVGIIIAVYSEQLNLHIVVPVLLMMVGLMVTIMDYFINNEKNSALYVINRKLKLFEWNEDC